jgi:eukaryotic-like serine/threonine-protein kinase
MSLQGKQLGKYQLERLLGSGGMGEVYLAVDTVIRRQVAIKAIRSEPSGYPDAEATKDASRLFQREVKAIAALDHPHILSLFDYGEEQVDGATLTYMVMPLRQEGTLTNWLRDRASRGLLSPVDVAQIIFQAAGALQYAHDRNIVHQDVKPANFLIRKDDQNPALPYLLLSDFGVARFTSTTTGLSQSIRGTPAYMAPELWEGRSVPATDQYALAIMAYELLTGRPPFQGGLTQMMYQHINTPPPPPSAFNRYLSPEIDQVLLIALAKRLEDRFFSVTAFATALDNAVKLLPADALRGIQQLPVSQSIYATLAISQDEALRGSSRELTLSDGRRITVSIPAGIHDGQVLYVDSQGKIMPASAGAGSVVLSIAVVPTLQFDGRNAIISAEPTVLQPPPPPSTGPYPYPNSGIPPTVRAAPSEGLYPYPGNEAAIVRAAPPEIPPSKPTRSVSPALAIALVALAIVVVGGGLLFYLTRSPRGSNSSTGTPPNSTVLSKTSTATPTPATAPVSTPASTNSYNPSQSNVALNDPLVDNSQGHSWMEGTNSLGATCQFSGGVYESLEPNAGYFHSCMEQADDFQNFTFSVKETLISGDYEGIVFRVNPADRNQYYFFGIYMNSTYILKLSTDANWSDAAVLAQGSSSAILAAPQQTNTIAVVADFSNITLFINQQQITTISDSTLSHGLVGMFAGNETNNAVVDFQDAEVWQ